MAREIQATTTRLEDKHEAIERTGKEAPKTYADIIKASTTNTKEKAIAEMRARQRQQRDALRQERAKYEVTLTMKETSDEVKESNAPERNYGTMSSGCRKSVYHRRETTRN